MELFVQRFNYALKRANINGSQLAALTGISRGAISHWKTGRREIQSFDVAQKVASALKINATWLMTGKGLPEGEVVTSLPDDVAPEDGDGYVQIKEFSSLVCGAGPGSTPTYEEQTDSVPATYRESFFLSQHIKPEDCMRFTVRGDSMQPTLFNGDKILVNTADIDINHHNNHVFAIVIDDEVRVKRLEIQYNKDIIIHSDNPAFSDQILRHNDDSIQFHIIGRVIERTGKGGL